MPKRDPMMAEIYKELIKETEGPTYIHIRTRIALCILAVTGLRINELVPLKVNQLKTLVEENLLFFAFYNIHPANCNENEIHLKNPLL